MRSFKKLMLNMENFDQRVEDFFTTITGDEVIIEREEKKTGTKITVTQKINLKKIYFTVYCTSKGTTLDFTKYGVTNEDVEKYLIPLKEWLEINCSYDIKENHFTLKNIEKEIFETLICLLKEEEENFEIKEENLEMNRIKIESKIDKMQITMTYYPTKTLLVQGKPAHCYWSIFKLLIKLELITVKEEENIILRSLDIMPKYTGEKKDINRISCIENLQEDCKIMINTYINLREIFKEKVLGDYSFLCFYPLRVSEAVLRKALIENITIPVGYELNSRKFVLINDEKHQIVIFNEKKEITSRIVVNTTYIKDAIQDLYIHFNNNRHGLFHGEEWASSRVISNYSEAEEISEKAIKLISDLVK
ncbi:type II toxin-antitoxin system RnlA family toxin [Cetobacterium sp. 2A]|uniref:type II toxin-antitoxin system RnlA family toxin n=1 Tax=Cetobacterium sp. 2A TaxID=2754723 RepID=UPI00163BC94B|nr:type II toxin-antitoxin system RnlA family toxin [Cetobacterium sp. 2A]MBC2855494.1 type II toxin-antitoxin system RnlA family toxin [Cetobacterium sp. 2A]